MISYCTRTLGLLLLIVPCSLWAKTLSTAEVRSLLKELTSQPQTGWIETGEIKGTLVEESWPTYYYSDQEIETRTKAEIEVFQTNPPAHLKGVDLIHDHLEAIPFDVRYAYRASTLKESTIVIRVDGERYYWEINLLAFRDLVDLKEDPGIPYHLTSMDEAYFATADPAPHAIKRFHPGWNKQRIFSWDGQEYTNYNVSPTHKINHASRETTSMRPYGLPTPLTEGYIPWGHGIYTLPELLKADVRATEKVVAGTPQITLTIRTVAGADQVETTTVLARKRAPEGSSSHALISSQIKQGDNIRLQAKHSSHEWMGGQWVPTQTISERPSFLYGAARTVRKICSLQFDIRQPKAKNMRPQLVNTLVEYNAPGLERPLRYRMSDQIDNEALLTEKLALVKSKTLLSQHKATKDRSPSTRSGYNCATLSLGYAARQLDRPIDDDVLNQLIDSKGMTSMQAMIQAAREHGLNAQAVRSDLDTLATLQDSQIILHIPGRNHFLLLGDVDSFYVWCIDLLKNKFLYRVEKQSFITLDWQHGAAIVLSRSTRPVLFQPDIELLSDTAAKDYWGGIGWTCTSMLQDDDDIPCDNNGLCDGIYIIYSELYECELVPTSGSCTEYPQWGRKDSLCQVDTDYPWLCEAVGDWEFIYFDFACDTH